MFRKKTDFMQDVREVRKDIQEMRIEKFKSELSKGWSEMTDELRKLYSRGVWLRNMIEKYKDSWAKGNLDHQSEEKAWIKGNADTLTRDWRIAKERHAERVRVWNKQAEELGLSAPTSPEEYSKLRGNVEYILGNRLVIDCMQL